MNSITSQTGVILVRHGAVAVRYRGLCYGRADVELGPDGRAQHHRLAESLSRLPIQRIVHSGMQRTRLAAETLAGACGPSAIASPLLQERDFGMWELQSWDAIFAGDGDAMLRMVTEPNRFRPGGGETTFEMRDRIMAWFAGLPQSGLTVAVTHGGPIAALLGTLGRLPVDAWPALIPPCGSVTLVAGPDGAPRSEARPGNALSSWLRRPHWLGLR